MSAATSHPDHPADHERRRVALVVALGLVVVLAIAVSLLALSRHHRTRREAHARAAALKAGPRVLVAEVKQSPAVVTLDLSGEARPWAQATLYAKVAGYLRDLHVDKGDRVQEGDLIATIESPETDRQYREAVADARNKGDIARRMKTLLAQKLVAAQDAEQAVATARVADEEVEKQRTLVAYEKLRAPFAGVVVARYVDPGALIQDAAGSATGTQPVLQIADDRTLRVFVYVDQRDAPYVRVGDPVTLSFPEKQRVETPAEVTRIAGAIDPATRMLLVEIDLATPKGVLPGGLLDVRLRVNRPSFPVVPSGALVVRGDKPYLAVVGDGDRIHFVPVQVISDDGQEALIGQGITAGQHVAVGVGERVIEGQVVQPVMPKPKDDKKPDDKKPDDKKP